MKKTVYLTEQDISNLVCEAISELSNVARLRRRVAGGGDWEASHPFMSSPDKYNPSNPRHKKGFDVLRDWANYATQNVGYNEDDVSKVLTNNPLQRIHNQSTIGNLTNSYKKVFAYCVSTLKLRPGVVTDIANCVGEDLAYGMLNQN